MQGIPTFTRWLSYSLRLMVTTMVFIFSSTMPSLTKEVCSPGTRSQVVMVPSKEAVQPACKSLFASCKAVRALSAPSITLFCALTAVSEASTAYILDCAYRAANCSCLVVNCISVVLVRSFATLFQSISFTAWAILFASTSPITFRLSSLIKPSLMASRMAFSTALAMALPSVIFLSNALLIASAVVFIICIMVSTSLVISRILSAISAKVSDRSLSAPVVLVFSNCAIYCTLPRT